jgi:IS5 family transposase
LESSAKEVALGGRDVILFESEPSMERAMSDQQMSLAEALLDPRIGLRGKLKALSEVIDWAPLEALANRVRSGEVGRKPYQALAMLKALYLASLYDLSDPALEEALIDRVSFRLFCGFSLDQGTPDETTLCRFRNDCVAAGVAETAFAEVNRQLDAKQLIVRKGTLLDATIVAAASRRPPAEAGSKPSLPREPSASFTRKGGKSHFGYRVHIGADKGSSIIRRLALTPAHVNESSVADALICGDEAAVYADKAYENKHRRAALKERGIKDRIMHRSHKNQAALPHWQQRRNALIAPQRAPIEAIFGNFKRLYRRTRMRYCEFRRNLADLYRLATVYNLRRAISLVAT